MRSASSDVRAERQRLEELLGALVDEAQPRLEVDDRLALDAEAEVAGLDDAGVHRADRDLEEALALDATEGERLARVDQKSPRGDRVAAQRVIVRRARTGAGRVAGDRDDRRQRARRDRGSRARTGSPRTSAWPATGTRGSTAASTETSTHGPRPERRRGEDVDQREVARLLTRVDGGEELTLGTPRPASRSASVGMSAAARRPSTWSRAAGGDVVRAAPRRAPGPARRSGSQRSSQWPTIAGRAARARRRGRGARRRP